MLAGVVLAGGAPSGPAPAATADSAEEGARLAPLLAGEDPVSDERISLARFKGKPVVVHVWASWCRECGEQAQAFGRFAREHANTPVLGVAVQDTEDDVEAFYARWKWGHPTILDADGTLAAKLDLEALPTTIFLNRRHVIVARIDGPADVRVLEERLEEARRA